MQELSSQNIVVFLSVLGVIFVVLSAFIIYLVYLNQYKVRLMRLEREMMQKQFDHQLLQTQMEIQEYTLQRISGEIHDNVGQLLSVAKLTLSRVDATDGQQKGLIHNTSSLIQQSLAELRALAHSLQAGNLLKNGLAQAIRAELNRLDLAGKYEIQFAEHGQEPEAFDQQSLLCFRIVQELLTNIMKHAEASRIWVTLTFLPQRLELRITDDGMGFDEALLQKGGGMGLHSMRKRAEVMHGELSFTQKPTTALLVVPVQEEQV